MSRSYAALHVKLLTFQQATIPFIMSKTASSGGRILTDIARHTFGSVGTLTISRPEKLNCLNSRMLSDIPKVLNEIASDDKGLVGIILTGEGNKAFIAGADLVEMGRLDSPAAARRFITTVHWACKAIRNCPVPVIARINGLVFGAGLELAAACDVRVASQRAEFGMPEVRMGLPSVVEAALLPNLIGWGRTRRLLLFGETISASEAYQWGLIERSVEHELLDEAVQDLIQSLGKCGRLAVKNQKALMNQWEDAPNLSSAIHAGIEAFGQAYESPDAEADPEPRRMIQNFLNRKKAKEKI